MRVKYRKQWREVFGPENNIERYFDEVIGLNFLTTSSWLLLNDTFSHALLDLYGEEAVELVRTIALECIEVLLPTNLPCRYCKVVGNNAPHHFACPNGGDKWREVRPGYAGVEGVKRPQWGIFDPKGNFTPMGRTKVNPYPTDGKAVIKVRR